MVFTLEDGGRIFLIPQLVRYFRDNTPGRDNAMASLHKRAKTVIAYAQDENIYIMESFDDVTNAMFGKGKGIEE